MNTMETEVDSRKFAAIGLQILRSTENIPGSAVQQIASWELLAVAMAQGRFKIVPVEEEGTMTSPG